MTKALRIILYLNFEINGTFNQCTFEPPPCPSPHPIGIILHICKIWLFVVAFLWKYFFSNISQDYFVFKRDYLMRLTNLQR